MELDGKGDSIVGNIPLAKLHTLQSTVETKRVLKMAGSFDDALYAKDGLPVAFKLPDGSYLLKDGNHRVNAALLAGRDKMPFEIYDLKKRAEELAAKKAAIVSKWEVLDKVDTGDLPIAMGMRDLPDPEYRAFLKRLAEKGDHLPPIPEPAMRKLTSLAEDPKLFLDKPRTVYIGMDSDKLAALKPGESWSAIGMRSCTWADTAEDLERARRYGKTIFKVEMRPGSLAVPARVMGLDEVALLPGARFEILDIAEDGIRQARLVDDGRLYVHELGAFMDDLKKTAETAKKEAERALAAKIARDTAAKEAAAKKAAEKAAAKKAAAKAAKEAKEAAAKALAEEIYELERAEALRRAEEAAKKAADPSKWNKLPKEDPTKLPTMESVEWGKLTRHDEIVSLFERTAKTGKGIDHIIPEKQLTRLAKVATDTDYALPKDTAGLFQMKSARIRAMYTGDEFDILGARVMTLGDDMDALQHVAYGNGSMRGADLYRIVVKKGSHVIPIIDDELPRMALLPGSKVRLGRMVDGVQELELLDDGREYVKKIMALYDQIEVSAGRPSVFGTGKVDLFKVEELLLRTMEARPIPVLSETQKKALMTVEKRASAAQAKLVKEISDTFVVDPQVVRSQIDEIAKRLRSGDIEFASNTGGSQAMYENLMTPEGRFKNQFELGRKATSGGSLAPYKNGPRDGWEKNIYGGVFHKNDIYKSMETREYFPPDLGRERPYYGYIHSTRKGRTPYVPSSQYGNTAFVFDTERVLDRVTFTVGNSSNFGAAELKEAHMLGTPEYPAPLLHAVYKQAMNELGIPPHLRGLPENMHALTARVDTLIRKGEALSGHHSYVEAQFIGDLSMDDVLAIVVPEPDRMDEYTKGLLPHLKRLAKATGREIIYKRNSETALQLKARVKEAGKRLKAARAKRK